MKIDIEVNPGIKIKFKEEKQAYEVQACGLRYMVCTKPFNLKKTVLYTIVDKLQRIRGTENVVFGMGAETKSDCSRMLERLESHGSDGTEISHRNRIDLNVEEIYK